MSEPSRMGWANGPMIGLDYETDSKDPFDAHVVTVSCIHYDGTGLDTYFDVAKPTRPIPDEAAKIHGYSTERAEEEGSSEDEVLADLLEFLLPRWTETCPLVIFNAPYDLTLTHQRAETHKLCSPDAIPTLASTLPIIDPLVLDKGIDRFRKGSRQLGAICKFHGIVLTDAHSSTADTKAAMRLAWRIGNTGPADIRDMSLMDLHRRQTTWYAGQAESLETYLRTKKQVVTTIDRSWPIKLAKPEHADTLPASEGEFVPATGKAPF
jgi:DNA polymerase-3 subunit epsilon